MYLRIFGFVGARIFWLSTIHDQIHFNNAQSVCFHGVWSWWWSRRCPETVKVFRRNQQLMPSIPQKLCMKYNKYFKHNPNAFFQLVRVVIIIYKKYISVVIQNSSSKTLEQWLLLYKQVPPSINNYIVFELF